MLPELAAVVLRRERTPERMASAGVRLGGLLAWGVEQARFTAELTGPAITEACQAEPFQPVRPISGSDFTVGAEMQRNSAAIARFEVVGRSGQPLELLVSSPSAKKSIDADGMIAHKLIRLMHSHPRRMSAEDLSSLFHMLAVTAAGEADLAQEADGLQLATGSKLLNAPRVVQHGEYFLLETALEGCRAEDLPAPCRGQAYRSAVLNWARTLLEDGVLHTFLRRDQLRFHGDAVGVTRWAGTYRPGPAVQAFVPSLAQAAFGPSAAERARQRSCLLGLLAHGLGVTGSLEDLADLCLELVSQGGPLQVARPLMPGLFIRQQEKDAPDRVGLIRLLRQLIWFRDLGSACGTADLALPWRELAHETGSASLQSVGPLGDAMGRRCIAPDALRLGGALLLGSVPVANIISRATAGRDLRYVGTGTVSSSNLYQAAGLGSFAAACLLDLGKGTMSAVLVRHSHPGLVAAAAGLTVAGHNWSLFQAGAGGRGVVPAMGILLVTAPPGAALIATGITIGYIIDDTALACFAAQLLLIPVLAKAQGRGGALLGLAVVAPMLAKRLLGNRPPLREHRRQTLVTRMIFDRDTRSARWGGQ